VLGQRLEAPADIVRLSAEVAYNSMDLLQAPHTFSGIEMALWDLLGKARGEPVWRLLGYRRSFPKTPYASVLFGATPGETLARAKEMRAKNFIAAKFGWGPIGRADARADADQIAAAREGLGPDGMLLVDTGQIFIDDVQRAAERLPALEAAHAIWFEEPFAASALEAYGALAQRCNTVKLAGGEGAHNVHMAKHLIDYGRVGFIQIDCGRIGGIGPSKEVADYAVAKGVTFVNHTFTSHLALSASMQPLAGLAEHRICEYPAMPKPLAVEMTANHLKPDANGEITAPDAPGLGIAVSAAGARKYLQDVDIRVNGRQLFATADL